MDKVYFPLKEKSTLGNMQAEEIASIKTKLINKYQKEHPYANIEVDYYTDKETETSQYIKHTFFPYWERDIQPHLPMPL